MTVRKVTQPEVDRPGSFWPRGFRADLSLCQVTKKPCDQGCGDICRRVTSEVDPH